MTDSSLGASGLSNRECLEVLYDQISKTLSEFKSTKYKSCRLLKLYFKSHLLEFIHNILIFICSFGLFISYDRSTNLFPNFTNAITLLIILVVNLGLCFHIYFKTALIMVNKVTQLKEKIQYCLKSNKILSDDFFADVNMLGSSSISCQLAIRDGKLVNLPLNLVVHGDVILLRPGETVNVNCRSLEKNKETDEYDCFDKGKKYDSSKVEKQTEPFKPTINRLSMYMDFNEALSSKSELLNEYLDMCALTQMPDWLVCVSLETPYIAYLNSVLTNYKYDSDSIFSNEFSRVRQIFLYVLIPIVLILQTCISTFYFLIFRGSLMENNFNKIFWTNIVYVLLPLLPISFTLFWKLTILHGTVCFLKTYKCLKKVILNSNPSALSELTYAQTKSNKTATSESAHQHHTANETCCQAEERLELLEHKTRATCDGRDSNKLSATIVDAKPSSSLMTNSASNCNQLNVDIESMYNGNDRSLNNVLIETNLNQDDISEINDLSSIDSLLAQMPASAIVSKKENYFSKLARNVRFYFKIVRSILFNRCESSSSKHKPTDFEDLQNAPFIYYSNFLVGLGIITNFSCIDKTGILSWPNPTAEKIWLFSQAADTQSVNSAESADHHGDDNASVNYDQQQPAPTSAASSSVKRSKLTTMPSMIGDKEPEKAHLETYNLTHDNANGYKLEFDDPNWSNNLNTLKPLGLSILLNTCNRDLIKNYKKFHDLLQLESFQASSRLINDQNGVQMNTMNNLNSSYGSSLSTTDDYFEVKSPFERRCLCQISKIIGFNESSATKSYELLGTNSIYRNLEIKPLSKLKPKQVLMSDLYSVVANCGLNGIKNLYSQGSPDLVLDFCSDYWDGRNVSPLNRNQRKKLLDLYQRYSASSYCTAFSYKPLLPDDTSSHSSDSTSIYEMNSSKALRLPSSFGEKLSYQTGFLNHYEEFLLSTSDSDSSSVATLEWEKKSYDQAYRSPGQEKRSLVLDNSFNLDAAQPPSPPNDSEQIQNRLRLHTNQIFLGMISMQYRAKIDVIKLVEKLTKSCVRFVHFSSDNEQISRAFAEILGLDTGWNCDISLATDNENHQFPRSYDESYRGAEIVQDEFKSKSSKSLDMSKPTRSRVKLTANQRNNKRAAAFLKPINSKFKKFNANYLRLNSAKKTVYQSLPSLKFAMSKSKFENADNTALNLNSSQIVKFDLRNVNKDSLEEDDAMNEVTCNNTAPKNRKLSSQSSIKSEEARNSMTVRGKKISSNSSSLAVLGALKNKLGSSSAVKQTDSKRINELNVSKLSVSSSKSSFRHINKQLRKNKKKRKSVDESSSHRTVYSSRTLSETEVLENAAQLPRGVENIRRHLDNEIDNVPLHVSLFTDSQKPAVIEMIKIMKDYGEVVCCFGSSHSIENNDVFSTANVSIGVEPLYPHICTARHPGKRGNIKSIQSAKNPTNHNRPINSNPKNALFDLSVFMNTLSCGLNLKHEDLCMLPPLIALAREMVYSYRIAIVFMLMCNLSVTLVQLICNTLFLPPILSGFQVLFLILFTIPLLSYSLIHKNESNDLRCSTKKNRNLINRQEVKQFCVKFLFKFLPSMFILVGFHFLSLYFECKFETNQQNGLKYMFNESAADAAQPDKKFNCHLFAFDLNHLKQNQSNSYNYWSNRESVQFSQLFNHFFISIYFVFLSLNHVCIEKSIWSYVPFRNKTWTKMVIIVFVIHLLYLVALLLIMDKTNEYFKAIPVVFWVVTGLWPILLIVINEIYKFFEIREILRQYKKLRLDFDTKLGLNSPFV